MTDTTPEPTAPAEADQPTPDSPTADAPDTEPTAEPETVEPPADTTVPAEEPGDEDRRAPDGNGTVEE